MTVRYIKEMVAKFNAIKLIKSEVELKSYSSSAGFLGYCNSKAIRFDKECVDAFMNMLALLVPDEIIVSSMRIHGNLKEHAQMYDLKKNDIHVRDRLIKQGLISHVALDDTNNCFHFCGSISKAALRDFILYQTTIGALPYHSFIINSDCELIIYPHDDCGLGFIISNDKNIEDINNKLYKFSEQYFDILEFHLKNDQVQV